jgi:hypothetical protein
MMSSIILFCGKFIVFLAVLRIRIRHLGSRAFLTPRSGIRDPGWVKNQDPYLGSGLKIPDHISERLETILLVKPLNSLMRIRIRDSESFLLWIRVPGMEKILPGSRINIPDPQTASWSGSGSTGPTESGSETSSHRICFNYIFFKNLNSASSYKKVGQPTWQRCVSLSGRHRRPQPSTAPPSWT